MKKFISFIISMAITLSLFPTISLAATSGTCGDNLIWELSDDGTLTISGTGAMTDYLLSSAPWDVLEVNEVIVEDGVTSIGVGAFYECSSLTSVTIPDSVASIGNSAFRNCDNLLNMTIPGSVTSIGGVAFYDCDRLTSVMLSDGVTSIGRGAFSDCDNLLNMTMPDSVTSIGERAFYYCDSLASVTIGGGVETIGDYAFYKCSSLTSVTIPDSVTSIGERAYYYCSNLARVEIGNGVESIGEDAFFGCANIEKVYINDLAAWCNIDFDDNESNPMYYDAELYIEGRLATDIIIPYGVESIGDYAFYNCKSMTNVTIPDSVTSIGENAFFDCTDIEKVYINDLAAWCNIDFGLYASNPTYYGAELYIGGKLATDITIPYGVESIVADMFYNCESLTSVIIPNSVKTIGACAFLHCTSLTNVTLGNSVTSIGNYAFKLCYSLTNVTILDSVTSIGEEAFDSSVTIYGYDGSVAEKYANDNGNTFIEIERPMTHSILVKNIQIGESVSLETELATPDAYAGNLIFATYDKDGRLVDSEVYTADSSANVSMPVGEATYGKLFWWDMLTLDSYCNSVIVEIK